jgi:nicotinamide phosphoribosyltransferase
MPNKKNNIILLTDCYKITHHKQYPADTKRVYSYLESRGGKFTETVFYGLQILLKKHLEGVVVERWMIEEADAFCKSVFGVDYFNREGWEYILEKHGGKLPVRIKAVPEGSVVPTRNVLMTMENTDDNVPWLTNFLETLMLEVWYPITIATLSWQVKDLGERFANLTSDNPVSPFFLNDFGFRGVSSLESAGIGGSAHLVNFLGTDTLHGIQYAQKYYNAEPGCGQSVMATEHSTTTVYGKENELEAYRAFIQACPEGILSVVSDSFDFYQALEWFGTDLKDDILARGKETGFAKFVVRPDSGNPLEMSLVAIQTLEKYFGSTINSKGFRVLNPKVGVIYGDGINYDSIESILKMLESHKYAIDNIVFGMGGGLLQQVDRDTQKFAFKCSAAKRGDKWIDVFKDPVTDPGKGSKRGKLKLIKEKDGLQMFRTVKESELPDQLVTVFENGEIKKEYTFKEIRERSCQF